MVTISESFEIEMFSNEKVVKFQKKDAKANQEILLPPNYFKPGIYPQSNDPVLLHDYETIPVVRTSSPIYNNDEIPIYGNDQIPKIEYLNLSEIEKIQEKDSTFVFKKKLQSYFHDKSNSDLTLNSQVSYEANILKKLKSFYPQLFHVNNILLLPMNIKSFHRVAFKNHDEIFMQKVKISRNFEFKRLISSTQDKLSTFPQHEFYKDAFFSYFIHELKSTFISLFEIYKQHVSSNENALCTILIESNPRKDFTFIQFYSFLLQIQNMKLFLDNFFKMLRQFDLVKIFQVDISFTKQEIELFLYIQFLYIIFRFLAEPENDLSFETCLNVYFMDQFMQELVPNFVNRQTVINVLCDFKSNIIYLFMTNLNVLMKQLLHFKLNQEIVSSSLRI